MKTDTVASYGPQSPWRSKQRGPAMGCGIPCSPEVNANRPSVAELLCLALGSRTRLLTDLPSEAAFHLHLLRSVWQAAHWGNTVQRPMRQRVCCGTAEGYWANFSKLLMMWLLGQRVPCPCPHEATAKCFFNLCHSKHHRWSQGHHLTETLSNVEVSHVWGHSQLRPCR